MNSSKTAVPLKMAQTRDGLLLIRMIVRVLKLLFLRDDFAHKLTHSLSISVQIQMRRYIITVPKMFKLATAS